MTPVLEKAGSLWSLDCIDNELEAGRGGQFSLTFDLQ